ncbi:FtsX-like permease family protein [Xylocopilactobacillus apis]|uniref:Permease n=1 Tax=Xylocopilactobacillus apis TaxID=2932183 RepID=A0AAU9DPU3_9LACO|nr:FtsX-like permease family protein [Xylocopilactobacillus apis]BDR57083.1 permease [Xylocopilactobacillus apis]
MSFKLAISGIKSRLKDYLVLFSGLMISAAIFYMFQSLASNHEFLKSNTSLQMIVFIFYFGAVLLGIITVVYINYANSFLLAMRQKVYAMYMMLGAKSRKIAQLIFLETLTIGLFAVAVGIILGLGLTQVVSKVLINQMDLAVTHFTPWNLSAILVTFVFFMVVFGLMALRNAGKLVRLPILKLLNQAKTPTRLKKNKVLWFIEVIAGIGLLAIGYWSMFELTKLQLKGLGIAIITIVLGSYFVFDALFLAIIQILRNNDKFRLKGLHIFTLGQLSFRVRDLTRLLAMISILFALALGAITVGLSFHQEADDMTNMTSHYDLVMHDPTTKEQKQIRKLNVTDTSVYRYKVVGNKVYWNADDFNRKPYYDVEPNGTYHPVKHPHVTGEEMLKNPDRWLQTVSLYLPAKSMQAKGTFLTDGKYQKIKGSETKLSLYVFKDFMKEKSQLKSLVESNSKKIQLPNMINDSTQKYNVYQVFNGMFSGFEFMGLFLGIAFLAMLASILMFKILSSAASDTKRYQMLDKIGTRKKVLQRSIKAELGVLFLMPGILGIIHVLFGLQMFKVTKLLERPYGNLLVPFTIFLVLYGLYYLITELLYRGLVLPKK